MIQIAQNRIKNPSGMRQPWLLRSMAKNLNLRLRRTNPASGQHAAQPPQPPQPPPPTNTHTHTHLPTPHTTVVATAVRLHTVRMDCTHHHYLYYLYTVNTSGKK